MKADKEEMTRLSTDKKKQFVCFGYMDPQSNWHVNTSVLVIFNSFTHVSSAGSTCSMAESELQ